MKTLTKTILFGLFVIVPIGSVTAQTVLSRDSWGAKPGITSRMKQHSIQEIVIHHTGVKQQKKYSLKQKLRGLQSYSQGKKDWGDVPYHFYIDMHGAIGEGRELRYAGDTNTPYNPANRIHIVLEGHFDGEVPSAGQVSSMAALVDNLQSRFSIPSNKISGHMDHASTDCPGEHLLPLVRQMASGGVASLAKGYVAPCSGAELDGHCFGLNEFYEMAQTHLLSYGCYGGAIDGDWGPMSRASLESYNLANGSNFSVKTEKSRAQFLQHFGSSNSRSCSN